MLYFKDQLVDEQIYKRRIDDAVKYSVISLNFHESNTILQETIANANPHDHNMPFLSRLGLAVLNGMQIFADVAIAMMNLWVFILAGIGVWVAIKIFRKKSRVAIAGK